MDIPLNDTTNNVQINLENTIHAIETALFRKSTNITVTQQQVADLWLRTQFAPSMDSWYICLQLLDHTDEHIAYFASNILSAKATSFTQNIPQPKDERRKIQYLVHEAFQQFLLNSKIYSTRLLDKLCRTICLVSIFADVDDTSNALLLYPDFIMEIVNKNKNDKTQEIIFNLIRTFAMEIFNTSFVVLQVSYRNYRIHILEKLLLCITTIIKDTSIPTVDSNNTLPISFFLVNHFLTNEIALIAYQQIFPCIHTLLSIGLTLDIMQKHMPYLLSVVFAIFCKSTDVKTITFTTDFLIACILRTEIFFQQCEKQLVESGYNSSDAIFLDNLIKAITMQENLFVYDEDDDIKIENAKNLIQYNQFSMDEAKENVVGLLNILSGITFFSNLLLTYPKESMNIFMMNEEYNVFIQVSIARICRRLIQSFPILVVGDMYSLLKMIHLPLEYSDHFQTSQRIIIDLLQELCQRPSIPILSEAAMSWIRLSHISNEHWKLTLTYTPTVCFTYALHSLLPFAKYPLFLPDTGDWNSIFDKINIDSDEFSRFREGILFPVYGSICSCIPDNVASNIMVLFNHGKENHCWQSIESAFFILSATASSFMYVLREANSAEDQRSLGTVRELLDTFVMIFISRDSILTMSAPVVASAARSILSFVPWLATRSKVADAATRWLLEASCIPLAKTMAAAGFRALAPRMAKSLSKDIHFLQRALTILSEFRLHSFVSFDACASMATALMFFAAALEPVEQAQTLICSILDLIFFQTKKILHENSAMQEKIFGVTPSIAHGDLNIQTIFQLREEISEEIGILAAGLVATTDVKLCPYILSIVFPLLTTIINFQTQDINLIKSIGLLVSAFIRADSRYCIIYGKSIALSEMLHLILKLSHPSALLQLMYCVTTAIDAFSHSKLIHLKNEYEYILFEASNAIYYRLYQLVGDEFGNNLIEVHSETLNTAIKLSVQLLDNFPTLWIKLEKRDYLFLIINKIMENTEEESEILNDSLIILFKSALINMNASLYYNHTAQILETVHSLFRLLFTHYKESKNHNLICSTLCIYLVVYSKVITEPLQMQITNGSTLLFFSNTRQINVRFSPTEIHLLLEKLISCATSCCFGMKKLDIDSDCFLPFSQLVADIVSVLNGSSPSTILLKEYNVPKHFKSQFVSAKSLLS